jgi:hypothetical protein
VWLSELEAGYGRLLYRQAHEALRRAEESGGSNGLCGRVPLATSGSLSLNLVTSGRCCFVSRLASRLISSWWSHRGWLRVSQWTVGAVSFWASGFSIDRDQHGIDRRLSESFPLHPQALVASDVQQPRGTSRFRVRFLDAALVVVDQEDQRGREDHEEQS